MSFFKEFLANILIILIPFLAVVEICSIIFFAVTWNPFWLIFSSVFFIVTSALIITFLDN